MSRSAKGITLENPNGVPINVMMEVDPAANKAFETADILAKRIVAGALTTNGKVSMGTANDEIFGIVRTISTETTSTASQSVPDIAGVQVSGEVAEVAYNTATASSPSVGSRVVADGTGKVKAAVSVASNATIAAGAIRPKNWQVLTIDTANALCTIVKS